MSVRVVANNLRLRRTFGKIRKIIDIPNLIEIQRRSYEEFLQLRRAARRAREDQGLQGVFKSVFPIKDFNETASLEFVSYTLGEPKYDVEECHQRGMTFAAPLKVTIQLVIWDVDPESGARSIKNVKEQEVYFGEIPLMTDQRHLHGQRHRAGHRQPAAPLARACSSTTTRARRTPAASCCTRRASSRTAARGSISSSTRATSSSCASTGGASSTPRCCCARSA